MNPTRPPLAQIVVTLHDDLSVAYQLQSKIPSVNAVIMMLERAKLQLFVQQLEAERKAAEQVIETPSRNFDPGTYVGPDLRLVQ